MADSDETLIDRIVNWIPIAGPLKRYFKYQPGMTYSDYIDCYPSKGDCESDAATAILKCKKCIDDKLLAYLMPFFEGAFKTGVKAGVSITASAAIALIKKWLIKKLGESGLGAFVPGVGWLFLISGILDVLILAWTYKKITDAADEARRNYCKC